MTSVLKLVKMRDIRVPIRAKLSLAITLVIGATILILEFTILTRQKDQLYQQTLKTGKVTLNYLANSANIPLLNDDIVRLNRLIKDAAAVEGIVYAAILDRHGTVRAHVDPDNIGLTLKTFQPEDPRKEGDFAFFDYSLPSGIHVLNLSRPITFRGKYLGTVHLGLSLDFLKHLIHRETVSILIMSILMALLGIAIAILLGVSFSRPISRLSLAAKEIGKGNLNFRIRMARKDELGDLASSFNYMAEELEKKEKANIQLSSERTRAENEARKLEEQLWQS